MTRQHLIGRIIICGMLLTLTTGCALFQPARKQETIVPKAFQHQSAGATRISTLESWWQALNDPPLNRLIETAFKQNLDLDQAFARLRQSRALVKIQAAAQRPYLNVEGQAHRDRQPGILEDTTENGYRLSLAAGFEIDLWRKLAKRRQAGSLEATASKEEIKSLYLGLSCQVADLYYLIIEKQALLTLTEETIKSFSDTLDRVEFRYHQGLVPALDVYQSRQNLAAARARRPADEANLATSRQAMAVLLGQFNIEKQQTFTTDLPDNPAMFNAGVPATLLQQRPDIQSAWLQLQAGDARLAAAIADRFPTINLMGNIGRSQIAFGTTPVIGTFWQLLAGFTEPLIDGGRRRAEVERNRAVVQELFAGYQQKVIAAVREVEDALIINKTVAEQITHLKDEEFATRQALRLATEGYLQGLTDYLPVLTAQQFHFAARRQVLESRQRLMTARISLVRAIGGQWMTRTLEKRLSQPIKQGSPS
ncbi:MAG: efflux transporter outer membrane subunit [Xanthomonadaceae bacterium]|nr:efflux transporter outer membrane subunit [Xanthomonadaceae bacterium]